AGVLGKAYNQRTCEAETHAGYGIVPKPTPENQAQAIELPLRHDAAIARCQDGQPMNIARYANDERGLRAILVGLGIPLSLDDDGIAEMLSVVGVGLKCDLQ